MAKKNENTKVDDTTTANPENEEAVEGVDASDSLGQLDFNVDDEYKPEPLIPKGTYHATATSIKYVPAQFCIVWDFCLHDNGGTMNDGETPIDGAHVFFRNWLPKPGDESELTKNGKNNKRQSKINMLKDFQVSLGVDMSTAQKIANSLADQVWIGVEADVDVAVDEYQGKFRNVVNKCKKSMMY
jgi:hypothetical protein